MKWCKFVVKDITAVDININWAPKFYMGDFKVNFFIFF